jgi:hypothetical protein
MDMCIEHNIKVPREYLYSCKDYMFFIEEK